MDSHSPRFTTWQLTTHGKGIWDRIRNLPWNLPALFRQFCIPVNCYVVLSDFLISRRDVLKEFIGYENLVMENVPVFMRAGVGCNRDAV